MNWKSKFIIIVCLVMSFEFVGVGVGYSQTQGSVTVKEPGGGTNVVPSNVIAGPAPVPTSSGGFESPLSYPVNSTGGTAGAVLQPQVVHKHKKRHVVPTPVPMGVVVPLKPMPAASSKAL